VGQVPRLVNASPVFNSIDTDAKGFLTAKEVQKAHQEMHFCQVPITHVLDVLRRYCTETDGNKDPILRPDKFLDVSAMLMTRCRFLETIRWDFLSMENNGYIDPPDRVHILIKGMRGPFYNPSEVDEFLAARKTPSLGVNFEEYSHFLCSKVSDNFHVKVPISAITAVNAPGRPAPGPPSLVPPGSHK